MGVTNFDNLPQNIVSTRLAEARQTIREQKGSLQVTTGNNLRYFTMDNGSGMAWQGSATGYPTFVAPEFLLTLTSETEETFLSDVSIEFYRSTNGGATWTPIPNVGDYSAPEIRVVPIHSGAFIKNQAQWQIKIFGNDYLGFKYEVVSTDKLTATLVRTD